MHCYIPSIVEEYSWMTSLSVFIMYSLCLYSFKNVIVKYTYNMNKINDNLLNNIIKLSNFTLPSIKESHNDKYKQKMFHELLNMNSLERCYILYFIFKKKGDFKSFTSIKYINNELITILKNNNISNINNITNIYKKSQLTQDTIYVKYEEIYTDTDTEDIQESTQESTQESIQDTIEDTTEATQEATQDKIYLKCEEIYTDTEEDTTEDTTEYTTEEDITEKPKLITHNSYELYDKIMNKIDLNLDETISPDIQIQIGENKYELTEEKLNFIQWLYYIGLYDYLTDINNIDIKYDILTEMNKLGLLTGNLFLQYQLFLCDYEYEKKLSFTKT